jgi:rubrerythrin
MSATRALRSKKMPTPKFFLGTEDDGWITANVGGLRVLSLLGFILCGMRLERDFVENGVNKRFQGTVTFVWCNKLREKLEAYMGNEHAKITMNVHVDYDDGDGETLDLWDLAQRSHWSMRMNESMDLPNLLIGQVVRLESGENAVVREFDHPWFDGEQAHFWVVLQADPLTADGLKINIFLMSLEEVIRDLIRYWQKEFERLVGMEMVCNPFVATVKQKEAIIDAEVDAQRIIHNGSQPFFASMYAKLAENKIVAKARHNEAAAAATAAATAAAKATETCSVCLAEKVNRVLIPCGHIVLCGGCADTIIAVAPRRCPICRAEIVETHHVVFPSAD